MHRNIDEEIAMARAFEQKIRDPSSPWTGPEFEWQDPSLAATMPEPHIAFDPEYVASNDIEVDLEYVLRYYFAYGLELGWRRVHRDQALVRHWLREEADSCPEPQRSRLLEFEGMLML